MIIVLRNPFGQEKRFDVQDLPDGYAPARAVYGGRSWARQVKRSDRGEPVYVESFALQLDLLNPLPEPKGLPAAALASQDDDD